MEHYAYDTDDSEGVTPEHRAHRSERPLEREDEVLDAGLGDLIGVASEMVENQLRARPLPTLLAALAAGWIVGRILR